MSDIIIKPFPVKPITVFIIKAADPCKGKQPRVNLPSPSGKDIEGDITNGKYAKYQKSLDKVEKNLRKELEVELGDSLSNIRISKIEDAYEKILENKGLLQTRGKTFSAWILNSNTPRSGLLKDRSAKRIGIKTIYHREYLDDIEERISKFRKNISFNFSTKAIKEMDDLIDTERAFTRIIMKDKKKIKTIKIYRGIKANSFIEMNIITQKEWDDIIAISKDRVDRNSKLVKLIKPRIINKSIVNNSVSSWSTKKSIGESFGGIMFEAKVSTNDILSSHITNSTLVTKGEFEVILSSPSTKLKNIISTDTN